MEHRAYVDEDESGTLFMVLCKDCDLLQDADNYSDASVAAVYHRMITAGRLHTQDTKSEQPGRSDHNDSLNMGVEDYMLGRPNRRDDAPNPDAYQDGWDQAARQEEHEANANRVAGL